MAAQPIQYRTNAENTNWDGYTALHLAASTNSVEATVKLIQRGADVDEKDIDGNTPLHWASRENSKETAAELLQRGADVNSVNKDGDTPLHWAISERSKETAAELIQHGANVKAVNNYGNTPLHWATSNNDKETVAELIQRGANINAVDKDGKTPLHWASINNSKETATELIQHGANINAVNRDGNTPLHWACINNSKETAAELIHLGAGINAANKDGINPLHLAIINNSKGTATELIQLGADVNEVNKNGITTLHLAIQNNSKEIAVELIQRGANINSVDKDGNTLLHWASINNSKETAAELLQRGADVTAVNKDGDTSLHWASIKNSKDIAAKLIELGADVNAFNKDGNTPLHLSIINNSKETAAELIERGADCNAADKDGDTPLHLAIKKNNKAITVKLLSFNADLFIKNKFGSIPLISAFDNTDKDIFLKVCQKIQYNPLYLNHNCEPYFHAASKYCINEILDIPDSFGGSRDVVLRTRDHNGNSPLHFWATAHFVCRQRIEEFGERLIKMGAKVNARNDEDQTPLHVASSWTAVDVLVANGAWPNVKLESHGDTPLLTRAKRVEESSSNLYDGFCPETKTEPSEDILIQEWYKVSKNGMDPWITNRNGESVLKHLINRNNFLLANALVSFQTKESAADSKHTNGETILHIICTEADDKLQTTIDNLLKSDVNVNCLNATKQTPLHLVCKRISTGDKQNVANTILYWTVGRLLANGADPTLKDCNGVSCHDIAEGVSELSELLQKPLAVTDIPQLLKWSDPKSEKHRDKIAQVVRKQNSLQVECFHFHKSQIGSGSFGRVFAGVNNRNGREIAVKRIEQYRLTYPQDQREITNLTVLQDCAEIVRYHSHYDDGNFVYLILDLMEGTLTDYLKSKLKDPSHNVTLCRDVINGLNFLHLANILHRDINPRNILYKLYPRICLKLADFGLSKNDTTSNIVSVMHTAAGTRCWMAPELLRATERIKHSKASDVFAGGLVLHFLLADQRHPFTNPLSTLSGSLAEQNETEQALLDYKTFLHEDLTPEARDLIQTMLLEKESDRPKAADILYHPFFWTEVKRKDFVVAVGNQPEIMRPRNNVDGPSDVELELKDTLGKQNEITKGWEKIIPHVYMDMTMSGRRIYDTFSAVELLRFVRNCYAHASDPKRAQHVKELIRRGLLNKFPTLIIDVYRAVVTHGWDKRMEIEDVLKTA